MESAFGIEHGKIAKSMSTGKYWSLKAANMQGHPKTFPRTARYAGSKLGAHSWGKEKGKLLAQGKTENPTGHYMSGQTSAKFGRDQLEVLNTKKHNRRLP